MERKRNGIGEGSQSARSLIYPIHLREGASMDGLLSSPASQEKTFRINSDS
jgi:hypothetical protein